MDGGQSRTANGARSAAKPPQGFSTVALDKKLGLKRRAREDAARNLPRHVSDDLSAAEQAVIEAIAGERAKEHDPQGFSLYASDANYAAWRAASPNGPPDLSQVDLRIVPIDRPDHAERQAYALDNFWPAFFNAADTQSVSIDPAP